MRALVLGVLEVLGVLGLLAIGCEKEARGPVQVEAAPGAVEVRALVGPEGGSLAFPGKGARLEIPAGLLDELVAVTFRREKPTFDLEGKDFVGEAYRISPRMSFAPGVAKLFVPVDRALPGPPTDIQLKMFSYEQIEPEGPEAPATVKTWQPQPLASLEGFSQDLKHLVFLLRGTISDSANKSPYGQLQAGFDLR